MYLVVASCSSSRARLFSARPATLPIRRTWLFQFGHRKTRSPTTQNHSCSPIIYTTHLQKPSRYRQGAISKEILEDWQFLRSVQPVSYYAVARKVAENYIFGAFWMAPSPTKAISLPILDLTKSTITKPPLYFL